MCLAPKADWLKQKLCVGQLFPRNGQGPARCRAGLKEPIMRRGQEDLKRWEGWREVSATCRRGAAVQI